MCRESQVIYQVRFVLAVVALCFSGCSGCEGDASESKWQLDTSYDAVTDAPTDVDTESDDAAHADTGATSEDVPLHCVREVAAACDPAQVGSPCDTASLAVPDADSNCGGRCREGVVRCEDGVMVCKSLHRPMPETCNGLDDDCNGMIDDLSQSWSRPIFSGVKPTNDDLAKTCHQRDHCACPAPSEEDHVGSGATFAEEYRSYMDAWTGECQCRAE